MRTITLEEIDAGMEQVTNMDMAELEHLYALLQKEQPFLHEYVIAYCADELSARSEDPGIFVFLAMAVWHIMRSTTNAPMTVIDEAGIKQQVEKIMERYSSMSVEQPIGEPLNVEDLLADSNQKPLLTFVLKSLMEPNEDGATADFDSLLFSLLTIIIECLDHAKSLPAGDASNEDDWDNLLPEV